MFGAPAYAKAWDESPEADRAPTLAAAPEGLSARRVERWLDLPPGAWQKRRLYGLRLKGQGFLHLGLRPGDLVIVEPGAREQSGTIVVTRSPQGPSLKRVAPQAAAEHRIPTVLELPLRERNPSHHGEHVVGAVIGVLRATGTGALRPVALSGSRPGMKRRMRARRASTVGEDSTSTGSEGISLDRLLRTQQLWRAWVSARRSESPPRLTPAEAERWERLDASLATLCDCLSHTHSPELRTALSIEAGAVVATIREEMRG